MDPDGSDNNNLMMRREGLAGAVTFCLTQTLLVGLHGENIEEKGGKLAQLKAPKEKGVM